MSRTALATCAACAVLTVLAGHRPVAGTNIASITTALAQALASPHAAAESPRTTSTARPIRPTPRIRVAGNAAPPEPPVDSGGGGDGGGGDSGNSDGN